MTTDLVEKELQESGVQATRDIDSKLASLKTLAAIEHDKETLADLKKKNEKAEGLIAATAFNGLISKLKPHFPAIIDHFNHSGRYHEPEDGFRVRTSLPYSSDEGVAESYLFIDKEGNLFDRLETVSTDDEHPFTGKHSLNRNVPITDLEGFLLRHSPDRIIGEIESMIGAVLRAQQHVNEEIKAASEDLAVRAATFEKVKKLFE